VQAALLPREGPPIVFSDDLDATCASLAAYSMHDAQMYHDWYLGPERALIERLVGAVYAPPPNGNAAGDGVVPLLGALPPSLQQFADRTPHEVVEALFQSLEVRTAFLQQLVVPWGILPDYVGMGWAVFLALSGAAPLAVSLGGAHVTAQALIRALVRRGGRYQVLKPVRRVLVEDGAAVGVELADGTRLRARAVVSSSGLAQTLLDLVGAEHWDGALLEDVRGFQLDEFALFGVHVALARAPSYE
jgi:phytoene dehydrogenase-like protein